MEPPDELQIDQALFGYSDGHRQLAASLRLPSKDMYDLAARSDMEPGASISPDRSYISGFRLAESRLFAVIKTWPAPEMRRPGCVWSHVLLLPPKFLSTQVNLGILEGLLKRPSAPENYQRFEQRIAVKRLARSAPAQQSAIAEIVSSYYREVPIVLDDTPDDAFEAAIFSVWSQQWPRLRADFAFRTVLSPDARPTKGLIIRVKFRDTLEPHPNVPEIASEWVQAAVADAVSAKITPLRRFLWRYGKDVLQPRRAFPSLIRIYITTKNTVDGISLAKASEVIATFPESGDALTLKRDLIGANSSALTLIPRVRPADFAKVIVRLKVLDEEIVTEDELRNIVTSFKQPEATEMACNLAEIDDASREAGVIQAAIVDCLSGEMLEHPGIPYSVIVFALRRRPELLERFDAEQLEPADAISLLDVSEDGQVVAKLLRRILTDRVSNDSAAVVRARANIAFGEAVLLALYDRLHSDWRNLFAQWAELVLEGGFVDEIQGAPLVARAIELLDFPLSSPIDVEQWYRRAKSSAKVNNNDRTIVDAFLLVLCLRKGIEETIHIVNEVLPRLRLEALQDSLPFRVKSLLSDHLPSVNESWDLNKRLLKILRRAYKDQINIFPVLGRLNLSNEELSYITGEEDMSMVRVLAKLFWPFF